MGTLVICPAYRVVLKRTRPLTKEFRIHRELICSGLEMPIPIREQTTINFKPRKRPIIEIVTSLRANAFKNMDKSAGPRVNESDAARWKRQLREDLVDLRDRGLAELEAKLAEK